MSRKNPFANLDLSSISGTGPAAKSGYGMTGAAKTVVRSIEEMAENTKRLMDGETIVEIEPQLLDVSFASDRLSDEDAELLALQEAIRIMARPRLFWCVQIRVIPNVIWWCLVIAVHALR